jgi:TetR/AcrR family transcriptional repressor of bet genes
MPKTGMEPIRRKALIEATIRAIHANGYCGVTVGAIAREAKVSKGLALFYFGSKQELLAETMRALYRQLGADIRAQLAAARTPRERISAIIRGNLAPGQFAPEVVSAWLAFYTQAQTSAEARKLLALYHRRLRANLAHALRAFLSRAEALAVAEDIGAFIDGASLRQSLGGTPPDPQAAVRRIEAYADLRIAERPA